MARNGLATRSKILDAASDLLFSESVTDFNLDRISEGAGITKKTLHYHFPSKDHLLTAVVDHQRTTYLGYQVWAEKAGQGASVRDRVLMIFKGIAISASDPRWKGCCFVRVAAELGDLPGHPAREMVVRAIGEMESWLERQLAAEGRADASGIARQLVVLLNGIALMHMVMRSGYYAADAMELLGAILPDIHGSESTSPRHLHPEGIDKRHFLQSVESS